ncbi:adhesion G protein-coupled receptor E2-like [Chrysemys picta bellii]|uniref:adhesion G protein-coupled receptor E2-like n=1 Tax=Chrysemys picta bellii TaxID=8478 RepID=UPI0032B0F5F4
MSYMLPRVMIFWSMIRLLALQTCQHKSNDQLSRSKLVSDRSVAVWRFCIALCLGGTVAQNHGVQAVPAPAGTTEDCNSHLLCPANAKCVNNTHCTCLDGYQPDGNRFFFTDTTEICNDINECLGPSPPDCGRNAHCTNVAGNYYCTCIDGYEPSSGKDKFTNASENTCQDIDECQRNATICEPHGNCINMPGSYMCKCSWGFGKSQKNTSQICTGTMGAGNSRGKDINECNKNPDICSPKATCVRRQEHEGQAKRSEATLGFSALLKSTSLWDGGDKGDVGLALTVLLQSVELAALATALQSPEITTQNMTTESMDEGGCVALSATCWLPHVITEMTFRGPTRLRMILLCFQAKKEEDEALCVYWKVEAESSSWSPDGCTAVHTNSTHTTCSCDHLSSFAILMAPTTVTENYPLTIITYVGLTLSLLCLFLAILTFLLCRSIRNVSTSLHLQLCLCLFLANLLFLTPVTPTGSQVACAVIAGLLHYLFLACFSWMFLEGLHLFLTVRNLKVVNYTSASRFKKRFMYPFGYGFPALVVAISAAVNPDGYGTSKHCWLSLERGFRWSFLGPVCAIILINITFFALTLWILRNRLSSLNADVSTLRDHRLLTFKAIAQLFILGCTWSLGLLQVGPAATVMAYLFTIVNSLQGAFIFLVHCLLNRQVREEYRRWIKGFRMSSTKSQTSDLSMSAVPTTSTKTVRGSLLCSNTSL